MKQGEVWTVDLEPTIGSEIGKVRVAIIVNRDDVGRLPLRVVVPLTGWQESFRTASWMVRVDPTSENGLAKLSAADTFEVRSVSTQRFRRRAGRLSSRDFAAVIAALKKVFE
jgi:mRNA interferase MazF